jgi:hypothetical protein
VADFGCDSDGNLVIKGDSFPLKISDLTSICYRWNVDTYGDESDCYIRFDFGKDIYMDCSLCHCDIDEFFDVKFFDKNV